MMISEQMISEKMYRCCWQMAGELLRGLERGDLALIEERLGPLRQTLAARGGPAGAALQPGGFLWLERLDLLEGITESVAASMEALRRSNRPHLRRIETAGSLLRHLVKSQGNIADSVRPINSCAR